jgi:hypothetical protein
LSLFALDPANTARGCRACCNSDDRVVPHQPHRTFIRSDGRHGARRPDARRDQWSRTHADHNAGSDTMQQNAAPSRLSLFALDPAYTARGLSCLLPFRRPGGATPTALDFHPQRWPACSSASRCSQASMEPYACRPQRRVRHCAAVAAPSRPPEPQQSR